MKPYAEVMTLKQPKSISNNASLQYRRQSKWSEGAPAKSGEHWNLRIKTDLQILYGYNYAQFENKAGSVS